MSNFFMRPSKKDTIVLAILYLLAGLALCFFKGSILVTAVRVMGIALVVYGVYQLYIYFGIHQSTNMQPMIFGIPSLVLGLILAIWPNVLINFFPIIAGVLLIFNSIVQIQSSLVLKSAGASSWLWSLVFALALLACGVFLVVRPSSVINTILVITGAALIAQAVVLIFDAITGPNV